MGGILNKKGYLEKAKIHYKGKQDLSLDCTMLKAWNNFGHFADYANKLSWFNPM